MELDRLNLDEVSQMAKLIKLMGTPAAPDALESTIRILECAAYIYRKSLETTRAATRNHGE